MDSNKFFFFFWAGGGGVGFEGEDVTTVFCVVVTGCTEMFGYTEGTCGCTVAVLG